MRAILNISMPIAEKKHEDELVKIIKQAEKDHREGKTKKLRGLEYLM